MRQFFPGLSIMAALLLLSNQVMTIRAQSTEDITVTEDMPTGKDRILPIPAPHEIAAQLAKGSMTLAMVVANTSTQFILVFINGDRLVEYSAVGELSSQMRSLKIADGHKLTLDVLGLTADPGTMGLVYHEDFDYGVVGTGPNDSTIGVINFYLPSRIQRFHTNGQLPKPAEPISGITRPKGQLCIQFNAAVIDPKKVTPICVPSNGIAPDAGFYDPNRALVLFYISENLVAIYSVPLSSNIISVVKFPYKNFFHSTTNGPFKWTIWHYQIVQVAVAFTILLWYIGICVLCCFKRCRTRIMIIIDSLSDSLRGSSSSSSTVKKRGRKHLSKSTPSSPLSSSSRSRTSYSGTQSR